MRFLNIVAGTAILATARAVDMTRYTAGPGVEPGFKYWLRKIYLAAEGLNANHSFTDFFVYNNGTWRVGSGPTAINATGQQEIIDLKYQLLPPSSNQIWVHVPNSTAVYSETAWSKTYQVNGTINKDLAGYKGVNNCSAQYYQEKFTVAKYSENGAVILAADAYSLILYDDYGLQPEYSPNSMPCESPE